MSGPAEIVPSQPPLVVIGIVSRDDRHTEVIEKLEEYRRWGVANVRLVDPWLRKTYVHTAYGLREVPAFELPEYSARLNSNEILA